MKAMKLTALALLTIGLSLSRPARAVLLSVPGPPMVALVAVATIGDESWVAVSRSFKEKRAPAVLVVPLPDGATDVRVVESVDELDSLTSPRQFKVERPPTCDPTWSCDVPRPAIEPGPRLTKSATPVVSSPWNEVGPRYVPSPMHMDCFGVDLPKAQSVPVVAPPLAGRLAPPPVLRIVPRDEVAKAVLEVSSVLGRTVPSNLASELPNVARFAVLDGQETLGFRVRGAFTWPAVLPPQGGPTEVVMVVVAAEPGPSGALLFPRQLLRAEPPRLYINHPGSDLSVLAGRLAAQLASEGKPIQLERAMPVPENDPLSDALGISAIPGGSARAFRLFRYRFRNVTDVGLARANVTELPHPRELATGFVDVDEHPSEPGDPRCPHSFQGCYRPVRQDRQWRAYQGFTAAADAGPRLVEAPFSLATPLTRDPSPPATQAASAASSSPSTSEASENESAKAAPGPHASLPPTAPGPRGCACDTADAVPSSTSTALGATLAVLLVGLARRERGRKPG